MSLTEKRLRMKTIAGLMSALSHIESYKPEIGKVFSDNEKEAFADAVDTLDHFIALSSAQT